MRKIVLLLFTLLLAFLSFGQIKPSCSCPSNTITHTGNPEQLFHFSNGKSIGLCGYIEVQNGEKIFSEFVIYQCGQKKILTEWGAVQSCAVTQHNDTLIVKEFYNIANGKNLSLQSVKFYTTKFFWRGNQLTDTSFYERNLKKYNASEIKISLKQVKQLKRIYNNDDVLLVAYRLFWAYVSGSNEAGKYLEGMEAKFGPFDGAIAEDFHDLMITYKDYNERSK